MLSISEYLVQKYGGTLEDCSCLEVWTNKANEFLPPVLLS